MSNLELINVGSAPKDGTGDPVRTAYGKCNTNTKYLDEMLHRTRAYNGFAREDETTLGISDNAVLILIFNVWGEK